jgi:hypothetical protein
MMLQLKMRQENLGYSCMVKNYLDQTLLFAQNGLDHQTWD